MPVTDHYIVRFLIQATEDPINPLRWCQSASGELRTELNGVRICLFHSHGIDGSRLCLRLSHAGKRTFIEEPRNVALIGSRYRTNDDRILAESLNALSAAVAAQCASHNISSYNLRDSIRDALFNRVLFGEP